MSRYLSKSMESTGYSHSKSRSSESKSLAANQLHSKPNQVGTVLLYGVPIVSLVIDSQERLCLAQISNTLLKDFSYNEIHNRRVALGITCVQCTPVQLEILRRAGAMPVSSRRCGMITRREAERLCKSFLGDNAPPRLPDDFAFSVHHECAWGCRGAFLPSRYNSSRAKCIKCTFCGLFFSPNKFIFHSHRTGPGDKYIQPDAANFNSWRRHMKLSGNPPDEVTHAWEDVKAMFNGGTRKRMLSTPSLSSDRARAHSNTSPATKQTKLQSESPIPIPSVSSPAPALTAPTPRVPPFGDLPLPIPRNFVMDYVWHQNQASKPQFPFSPYSLPWLKRSSSLLFGHPGLDTTLLAFHRNAPMLQEVKPMFHQSAFRPVQPLAITAVPLESVDPSGTDASGKSDGENSDDETVDIETTEDEGRPDKTKETSFWKCLSSRRGEENSTLSPGASDHTSSPQPTKQVPSPIVLKIESDEAASASQDRNFYEGGQPKVRYVDIPGYGNPYKQRSPSPINRAAYSLKDRIEISEPPQREAGLWSIAKLSSADGDPRRGSDVYRDDVVSSRNSYGDPRDDSCEQFMKSPIDCSACQARGPPLFSPGHQAENNNKIASN